MTEFDRDTALTHAGDGLFEGAVADGWSTPRGPLGGYVMALLLRAMTEAVGDGRRPVRSLTVNFVRSPVVGPIAIRTTIERQGRSVTTTTARLEQDGDLLAIAIATFSADWPGPNLGAAPMPDVDPPDGGTDPSRDLTTIVTPSFRHRLTMEARFGPPLFSGSDDAEVGGWLELKGEREIDALTVAVLADSWFPSPWPRLTELMPAPTIEMSVYFRAPLPLPAGPLLGRFRSTTIREGFFEEDGELWAVDGTLVAQSRQLGLLFKRS
jgi:acyl-CoA thioesterase